MSLLPTPSKTKKLGKYLNVQTGYVEGNIVNATPLTETAMEFGITSDGTNYAICGSNGLYIKKTGSNDWNTSSTATATYDWQFEQGENENEYYIKRISGSKVYLKYNGTNNYAYTDGDKVENNIWIIERAGVNMIPYSSLQSYYPMLYSASALQTLREQMSSATTSEEEQAAINAFYADAEGKAFYINSTTTAYSGQTSEYLYMSNVANGTLSTTSTPAEAKSACFTLEYQGNGNYYIRSLANGMYVGPTTGKSGAINANTTKENAGIYKLLWNTTGSNNSHTVIACQNPTGTEAGTYFSFHRNSSHQLVTWNTMAAASMWTIEEAHKVVIHYEKSEGDITLPEDEEIFFIGENITIDAPVIPGYEPTPNSKEATPGETVTFTYSIHTYTLTYRYVDRNGMEWAHETFNDRVYNTQLPTPSYNADNTANVTFINIPSGRVPAQDKTYTIKCFLDEGYPVVPRATLSNNAQDWVNLYLKGYAVGSSAANETINLSSQTAGTGDDYLWQFVGNPITGWKVYNKQLGSSYVLANNTSTHDGEQGKNTKVKLQAESTENVIKAFNIEMYEGGFLMGFVENGDKVWMNDNGNTLAYWNAGYDGGSKFTITGTLELTYNLQLDGVTKKTVTVKAVPGTELPRCELPPFVGATWPEGLVSSETTSYNIPCEAVDLPFKVSKNYEKAKWYYLHFELKDKYIKSANQSDTEIGSQATSEDADAFKWAFMGNPFDGFKVINKAWGEGYCVGRGSNVADGGALVPTTTDTAWELTRNNYNNAFTFKTVNGDYTGYWNDYENAGKLKYWNGNVNGSALTAIALPVTEVDVTYNYMHKGTMWASETTTVSLGAGFPTPRAPYGVTCESAPMGDVNDDVTVDIECSYNGAFDFYPSFADIQHWYTMSVTDTKYLLHHDASMAYMEVNIATVDESDASAYHFAFVGNPYIGYTIYNEKAGENMILSAPTPRPGTDTGAQDYALMRSNTTLAEGYNTAWDVRSYGEGFLLSRYGDEVPYYLNNRSGKLAFWAQTDSNGPKYDQGSRVRVILYEEGVEIKTTSPATVVPAVETLYRIYHVSCGGRMIYDDENHQVATTNRMRPGDLSQMWILHAVDNNTYKLRNAETGRMLKINNKDNIATTDKTGSTLYLREVTNETTYYGIGLTQDGSGNQWLNTNSNRWTAISWSLGTDKGSGWVFEPVTDTGVDIADVKNHVKNEVGYAEALTSGKYYRFINHNYSDRLLTENYVSASSVSGTTVDGTPNTNSQIWKLVSEDDTNWTFQNVLTGRYIQGNPGGSKQFQTGDDGSHAFTYTTAGGSDWEPGYLVFSPYLHDAQSQSHWVVFWDDANAPASYWYAQEVELTDADVNSIQEEYENYQNTLEANNDILLNRDDYQEVLSQIFVDPSCSELKPEIAALSLTNFKGQISSLPNSLQEMCLRVRDGKWDPNQDEEYNNYVKKFRISDYEIYTDRSVWGDITKVGPFAMFTNPTGITMKLGESVLVFVGDDPMDSDATIGMYIAHDTEYRTDKRFSLQKGINIITAHTDGELIVDYRLTNKDRKWGDYPTVKIHIEGGTANGCWDMNRGMNNADWAWLRTHMFKNKFLHVKGHSTMLNVLTANVIGEDEPEAVMTGWDFCFNDLQRLIGHDGQWDEYYRPMINPRHSYSGNPNWGGQSGSNHPGITKSYLFRKTNFTDDNVWEILHEEAHGHQALINPAGMTEISNNSLSQMVSYDWGRCYSRGEAGAGLVEMFNYTNNTSDKQGWTWLDYMRYAKPYYDYSLHVANQMLYHLYLYFDILGNKPERDFIPRLHDKMRELGGIVKGNRVDNPTYYYNDYWRLAKACAEVSKTDLWEFFEVYGMWKYVDEVISTRPHEDGKGSDPVVGSDAWNNGIRFLGDYGGYYLKMPVRDNEDDERRMQEMKDFMHGQPNKAPNILFMEDRLETLYVDPESPVAKLDPTKANVEKKKYWNIDDQGNLGNYNEYDGKNDANSITYAVGTTTTKQYKDTSDQPYTVEGKIINMSGDGLVGVKIYDASGKLIYISNTNSFFVPTSLADKLESGEVTLVAALADNTNLPIAKPSATKYEVTVYNGEQEDKQVYLSSGTVINPNIPYAAIDGDSDVPVLQDNAMAVVNAYYDSRDLPDALKNMTNTIYTGGAGAYAPNLVLTDKKDYYAPMEFTTGNISYERENTAGYNTVCLPFPINDGNVATIFGGGVQVYRLTGTEGTDHVTSLTFTELEGMAPAGTPLLVNSTQGTWSIHINEIYSANGEALSASGMPADDVTSPVIVGAYQSKTLGAGYYKLNSDGTKFVRTSASSTIKPFRFYLNIQDAEGNTNSEVREFGFSTEDKTTTTSLDDLMADKNTRIEENYDLSGRRVVRISHPAIVVKDGKKMIRR